jgi:tripartite-type tricarboxylate transporter receptor subunit TctC
VTVQRSIAAALLILLAGPSAVAAQAPDWPSRPLTMVVPFAAGGPVDVLATSVQYLGGCRPAGRVENIAGAGGATGSPRVAHGYRWPPSYSARSERTHSANLYKRPLYSAATDLRRSLITDVPRVLITGDLPS